MKKTLILLTFIMSTIGGWAQIPAEVTEVMNKCRAAMTNASGLEYEMDMKAGIGPVAMKMHFVVADKGKLSRGRITTQILGMDVVNESGFDGTNTWEIKYTPKGDTITITRGDKRKKDEKLLEIDYDKQYRNAKMKLKDGYYVITFSDPKDPNNEVKSVTIKISEKSHTLREMRGGARGAKITLTVTKIRIGLKDSYFKLDLAKYPNAVVIRK